MKIFLLISLTLLFAPSAFGQLEPYTTQEQLNHQSAGVMEGLIRTSERDLEAEARKRDKAEIYRLRQLTQTQINASVDKIAPLLFDTLSNQGYTIEQQSASQARFILSNKKKKKNFLAPPIVNAWQFNDSRINLVVKVNEEPSNIVTVTVRLVPNIVMFRAKYSDIKKIKKARTNIDAILAKIKSDAENNRNSSHN